MKKKPFIFFSIFAIAASLLTAIGINSNSFKHVFTRGDEIPNMLTIDKKSAEGTNTFTAKTAKGNNVVFASHQFDIRPNDAAYDNCLVFLAPSDGQNAYIKNTQEISGIKEIKIYSYSTETEKPTTLSTYSFNLYYGYEPVVISENNVAKVSFSNGFYSFEEGFEPSYIGLEILTPTTQGLCVSRIEISYKCEPVIGDITSKEGHAYKYDYAGKEFTTSNGKKIVYNVTDPAPWVHADVFGEGSKITPQFSGHSSFDNSTNTWLTTSNDYVVFAPKTGNSFPEASSRKYVSLTFTMSATQGGTGWGGKNADLYVGINMKAYNDCGIIMRIFNANVLTKTQGWEQFDKAISFIDSTTGEDLAGKSIIDKKVIFTFDATGFATINNVFIGTSCPTVSVVMEDITFKSTLCGHSRISDSVVEYSSVEKAYKYLWGGNHTICNVCGEIFDDSNVEEAPWTLLTPNSESNNYATSDFEYGQEHTLSGKSGSLYYNIPKDLGEYTHLAITAKTNASSYEFFYLSAYGATNFYNEGKSHYQFFSPNNGINYDSCSFLIAITNSNDISLGYNTSDRSYNKPDATEEVTLIFDLTHEKCDGLTKIKITGCAADTSTTFKVSLRKPADFTQSAILTDGRWDNWSPTICAKTNAYNFVVNETSDANGTITLGHYSDDTYYSYNFPNSNLMVRRLKFRMVKDLENPNNSGIMQWYFRFSGGSNSQLTIGNASTDFVQKSDMHVLDMHGQLIPDGSKFQINTTYQIELYFDPDNLPNHIQIAAEGVTGSNPWGYGHFIVNDFNQCLSVANSSFAA